MKTTKGASFPITDSPSLLNNSFKKGEPLAGMCANFSRPIQKKIVANAIKIPGIPKAKCGPYHLRIHGMSKFEITAPKLIEK